MFGLFNFGWFKRKKKKATSCMPERRSPRMTVPRHPVSDIKSPSAGFDARSDDEQPDGGDLTLLSYAMLGMAAAEDRPRHDLTPEAPSASESTTSHDVWSSGGATHDSGWHASDSGNSYDSSGDSGGGFDGGDCGGCDGGGCDGGGD
jgi:hypothetical protein